MIHFWPSPLDILGYSTPGLVVFASSAVVGLAWALTLGYPSRRGSLAALAVGLLVLAVSVHVAGVLTLLRDPERDLGSIPLHAPFAAGAVWAAIVLALVSPGLAAFLVTRVSVGSPRPHVVLRVAFVLVSIYAACEGPWALEVLFD